MSDRSNARRLVLIASAFVAIALLVLAYSVVFEGCQEPDSRSEVISPPDDGVGAPGTSD